MRDHMAASGRYTFIARTEARSVSGTAVLDDRGIWHQGDLVLVCAGAAHGGLVREIAGDLPIRRVRLQMMQTEPLDEPLTTAIADGDSFRYYPGFAGPALNSLKGNESQDTVADEHRMQLLCVQRQHGGLTIGDTHEYDEPFAFDVTEAPHAYLVDVVEEFLGRPFRPSDSAGPASTASASTPTSWCAGRLPTTASGWSRVPEAVALPSAPPSPSRPPI